MHLARSRIQACELFPGTAKIMSSAHSNKLSICVSDLFNGDTFRAMQLFVRLISLAARTCRPFSLTRSLRMASLVGTTLAPNGPNLYLIAPCPHSFFLFTHLPSTLVGFLNASMSADVSSSHLTSHKSVRPSVCRAAMLQLNGGGGGKCTKRKSLCHSLRQQWRSLSAGRRDARESRLANLIFDLL